MTANTDNNPNKTNAYPTIIQQIQELDPLQKASLQFLAAVVRTNPNSVVQGKIVVRGTWSEEEDQLLKMAIARLGTRKWQEICKYVPTRTPKQCRERWFNCLDPNIKRTAFEPWEDQIIIEKQKIIGNHWSRIAKFLPGRSPGSVKNRWYSGLNKSIENQIIITPLIKTNFQQPQRR